MKIGIVTFHFAHNYGAMLQTYAMQEKLSDMGHDTYVIDYVPEYHMKWFKRNISWRSCVTKSVVVTIRRLYNKIRNEKNIRTRYDNFQLFKNTKLNLYPYQSGDTLSDFDAVLLGSDQIWNESLTNNCFDGPYYGDGMKCQVFSYAASSMYEVLTVKQQQLFKEKLSHLKAIGVREPKLKGLLQPLTNKPISVTLDPTLLCSDEIYGRHKLPSPLSYEYVLVYELTPHKDVLDMAKHYAKKNGLKVISLVGNVNFNTTRDYDLTASPMDFLAYIKNAKCVFTTSFHGTALSIVFHKLFYAVKQNDKRDARISSLLSQLKLEEHFIEMCDRPSTCLIDYSQVELRLSALRKESELFLMTALLKE